MLLQIYVLQWCKASLFDCTIFGSLLLWDLANPRVSTEKWPYKQKSKLHLVAAVVVVVAAAAAASAAD